MNKDAVKDALKKIPVSLLVFLYAGYLAFEYYTFENDSESPLIQGRMQVQVIQQSTAQLQQKLEEAKRFFNSLNAKRETLRTLASELGDMKATLSEEVNLADFVKQVATEAKKIGLKVTSIRPAQEKKAPLYIEQPFEVEFKGVYVQLLVFLDRISNLKNIARVDQFAVAPSGPQDREYVELHGRLAISVFKYMGTRADEVAEKQATTANKTPGGGASSGIKPVKATGGGS